MSGKEYWYWLSNQKNIGVRKMNALLQVFESPKRVFEASGEQLLRCGILTEEDRETLLHKKNIKQLTEDYEKLKEKGVYFLVREENIYPEKLRNIFDSPPVLYVRGRIPGNTERSIAVVGARNCSNYGKEMAKYFGRGLAQAGFTVISGLAAGVDGYSHRGALEQGGLTYAVLGSGIDVCYPVEQFSLYEQIWAEGGILSEYGVGTSPLKGYFPMRNRIVSGLADGILVVEARKKSGALITADMALEQGKDVYAIPGRATDYGSEGCHRLIQSGAKLVINVENIVEEYGILTNKNNDFEKKCNNLLETKDKIVYACLSLMPKHLEQIKIETGYTIPELTEILLRMELEQIIVKTSKGYYAHSC